MGWLFYRHLLATKSFVRLDRGNTAVSFGKHVLASHARVHVVEDDTSDVTESLDVLALLSGANRVLGLLEVVVAAALAAVIALGDFPLQGLRCHFIDFSRTDVVRLGQGTRVDQLFLHRSSMVMMSSHIELLDATGRVGCGLVASL